MSHVSWKLDGLLNRACSGVWEDVHTYARLLSHFKLIQLSSQIICRRRRRRSKVGAAISRKQKTIHKRKEKMKILAKSI